MSELKKAWLFATKLLAKRDYSVYELTTRLAQRRFEPDTVKSVIQQLLEKDVLNEQRFVQSYVRSRARRGLGPRRIKLELHQRGVAGDLIDEWVCDNDHIWSQRAREVLQKKIRGHLPERYQEKLRCKQFLYYRGFAAEQICFALSVKIGPDLVVDPEVP